MFVPPVSSNLVYQDPTRDDRNILWFSKENEVAINSMFQFLSQELDKNKTGVTHRFKKSHSIFRGRKIHGIAKPDGTKTLFIKGIKHKHPRKGSYKTLCKAIAITASNSSPLLAVSNAARLTSNKGIPLEFVKEELKYYDKLESHPHIAPLLGSLMYDGKFVMYQPLYEQDLSDYTIKIEPEEKSKVISSIACQILQALAYVHSQKIMHNDLKPANILIRQFSNGQIDAALTDFGLACTFDVKTENYQHGSYEYCPPEVCGLVGINNDIPAEIGPHIDVWALGMTLYYSYHNMNIPYIFLMISHGLQIHEKIQELQLIINNQPETFLETLTNPKWENILIFLKSYLDLFPSQKNPPSDLKQLQANLVGMYADLEKTHNEIVRLNQDASFRSDPEFYYVCDLTMRCSQTYLKQVMIYLTIALQNPTWTKEEATDNKIIKLIRKMIEPDYKKRIGVEEVIQSLKTAATGV